MRNFTLGRNGIPFFFFAFLLLSGTSSYGQTCPTVDEPQQTFCDTEQPTVAELAAIGTDVVWYAEETSSSPLSPDTFLVSGEDYFAGSETDDTCDRVAVNVTIFGAPRIVGLTRQPATKQSTGNSIVCLQPSDPPMYLSDIQTDVEVVWYANDLTRDGGNEQPLSPSTQLEPGEEYYAGRVPSEVGGCTTSRAVLTVLQQMAPSAREDQWFCAADDPVLSDLVASGNNRYYATPTDFFALDPDTPLEDGVTYYVSQREFCESEDRTPIIVTVAEPAITDEPVQQFCADIADGDGFSTPTVAQLEPAGSIWFTDENFDTTLDPETELVDGEDYYMRTTNCDFSRVVVELLPTPNAGADTELAFCSTEDPVNLFEEIDPSALGEANPNGTFSPALDGNMFNPAEYEPGEHVFTYTVEANVDANGNELCPADEATITVTVNPTPDTGGDLELELCYTDFSEETAFIEEVSTLLGDRDPADLEPSLEDLYASISQEQDPTGSYTTTYTLTDPDTGCEDSAVITLNIGISPDAGTGGSVQLCASDTAVDLLDYFEEEPDLGGTISPALNSGGTIFDPAVDEPGTYTYTVESSNGICGSDETTIDVSLIPLADAGDDGEFYFCDFEGPQSLYDMIEANGVTTEGEFTVNGNVLTDGIFDPSANGAGEIEAIYTVQPTENCGVADTATYTLVVSETPEAPELPSSSIIACASEFLTVGDIEVLGDNIQWYYDQALTEPAEASDLLVSGNYYATQTNQATCESDASVFSATIEDAPTPTISEGGATFCSYDQPSIASLEDNMGQSDITWYDAPRDGNELSNSTLLQNGTTYYASITDPVSGCESAERLAVTAVLENCPLPIPDAFSPNGDGINDTFDIEFAEQEYPNYSIEIFNRWGKKVFTGNASNLWDGTSESGSIGGNDLPAGVYFYIFHFNDGQNQPIQGRVYLSR